jgi:hypothetical protein
MSEHLVTISVLDLTSEERSRRDAQMQRFERNLTWYSVHSQDIETANRGKTVCVAGEELFVGHDTDEVLSMARAAHPEDNGFFLRYIPRTPAIRIYAHRVSEPEA